MSLKINSFVAAAVVAFSAAAAAQTTPPATQPTVPDEPAATAPGQTQTTPGQTQTTPGPAAQTAQAPAEQLTKATAADAKAGVSVYDTKGGLVGKVASVDDKGVVVDTGKVKAALPLSGFAKNDKGLVLAMTKAELEAAAKKETPPK